MRAIITAAGSGSRWNNYLGRRKHQIQIDGETLLHRIVRQLNERGIYDIIVVCHPDHPYEIPGALTYIGPITTSNAEARLATRHMWHGTDRTLVILGDNYITDEAMDIMTEPGYSGWTHFARLRPSVATGKPGPEMFGCSFGPADCEAYADALHRAGPGSDWPAYCAMMNRPVDTNPHDIRDWGKHVEIPDDGTDDFDFPDDFERFLFTFLDRGPRRVKRSDFDAPWFHERMEELAQGRKIHRKLWEFCAIAQAYKDRLGSGGSLLGFGVGREPLAAWFAAQGATVLATDRPNAGVWLGRQHATGLADIPFAGICDEAIFRARVQHAGVDMTKIPTNIHGAYDMTYSSSCFEHLGGIKQGIEFFLTQMKCLKPGGIAVHTTEYNTGSNEGTVDGPNLCFFRQKDLQELMERMEAQGDRLWPIQLEGGQRPDDLYIDRQPFKAEPHLQLELSGHTFTSVLLIAVRGYK